MPLSFNTLSHGPIAFGFFNIDSNMLLLEHFFLFAPEFCNYVSRIPQEIEKTDYITRWAVYSIGDREQIGDLMGAIHGIRHHGFIGEVYKRFPFPDKPEAFKQKTHGDRTRKVIEEIIGKYAGQNEIPFRIGAQSKDVEIGEYRFSHSTFMELITYVWLGGYPRWKDDVRPPYVTAMKTKITEHPSGFFKGFVLS